jgi:Co/Zn/Cd efflux system component
MGILGAVLVMKWSIGLLETTSAVLLDEQMLPIECEKIGKAIESNDKHRLLNLHAWIIEAGACPGINSVVSINPHPSSHYKVLIEKIINLEHLFREMHPFKKSHENKLLQIARLTAPL